ncbi:transposase [Burkholderia aenigmatica]|uniref:transposase n=1 Tax=Burkholderia aenigmatica TaxID=2015348 RepID=UPI001F3C35C6|nr:transposase [Burkholderia aenigmatica]UKD17233.1 transposase [Burkholderia aenigmatica]
MENTCIERFDGRFRDQGPNEHGFVTMRHVTRLIDPSRIESGTGRAHGSPGHPTPGQFAAAHEARQPVFRRETRPANCGTTGRRVMAHA